MVDAPEQTPGWILIALLLGPLAALIVGSQGRSDARFVALVALIVLGPVVLALLGRAWTAAPGDRTSTWAAFGFFASLLGGAALGERIATRRERRQPAPPAISAEPIPPDDELF